MSTAAKLKELLIGDIVSWTHFGGTVTPVISATILGFVSPRYLRAPDRALVNHANTYPAIPIEPPVEDSHLTYNYIVVEMQTGINDTVDPPVPITEIREIGMPWIIPSTISRAFRKVLVITINSFDQDKLDTITTLLRNNGFVKSTMKTVSGNLIIEISDYSEVQNDTVKRMLNNNGFSDYTTVLK